MSTASTDTQQVKCSHCSSTVEFAAKAKKVRCSDCNTLIKIERKSMEELNSQALEGIHERVENLRENTPSVDVLQNTKSYAAATKMPTRVNSPDRSFTLFTCAKCGQTVNSIEEKSTCPICQGTLVKSKLTSQQKNKDKRVIKKSSGEVKKPVTAVPVTAVEAYLRAGVAYSPLFIPFFTQDEKPWLIPVIYFCTCAWMIPFVVLTDGREPTPKAEKIMELGILPLGLIFLAGLGLSAFLSLLFGVSTYY